MGVKSNFQRVDVTLNGRQNYYYPRISHRTSGTSTKFYFLPDQLSLDPVCCCSAVFNRHQWNFQILHPGPEAFSCLVINPSRIWWSECCSLPNILSLVRRLLEWQPWLLISAHPCDSEYLHTLLCLALVLGAANLLLKRQNQSRQWAGILCCNVWILTPSRSPGHHAPPPPPPPHWSSPPPLCSRPGAEVRMKMKNICGVRLE